MGETYKIFKNFEPIKWQPKKKFVYSIRQDHTAHGKYVLHNQNDSINQNKDELEKCLIEYRINGNSYELFNVKDILNTSYEFSDLSESNIQGSIRERIARKITKNFMNKSGGVGVSGGLLKNRKANQSLDNCVVESRGNYVLKTLNYPNFYCLKRPVEGINLVINQLQNLMDCMIINIQVCEI